MNEEKEVYSWLIPDHVDTTATNTLAAYDRFLFLIFIINKIDKKLKNEPISLGLLRVVLQCFSAL